MVRVGADAKGRNEIVIEVLNSRRVKWEDSYDILKMKFGRGLLRLQLALLMEDVQMCFNACPTPQPRLGE